MTLTFKQLGLSFAAEVSPVDLRIVHDEARLNQIRAGMDQFGVLVFHDQQMTDAEHLEFAQRFDGELHYKTGYSVLQKSRLGNNEALTDISNLDEKGNVLKANDRRRGYLLGNRLWHTDASFQDPPGRYSMLLARVIPPVPADTQFADMRGAYDALSEEIKAQITHLHAHHSIVYSRHVLGFDFSEEEQKKLPGAMHPLVRTNPRTGRKSLYLASHAAKIIDWPIPEGRLLLHDLMEHATQPQFTYSHPWRVGDLVIWDNLATMHRGRPFQDCKYRRELRRVTTLDVRQFALASNDS